MTPDEILARMTECRHRIDDVDVRLVTLLNERTTIVEEIGRLKQQAALPVYEPKREDEVFRNIMEHNGGPMPHDAMRRVFERIIDEMRTVQRERMHK